MIYFLALALAVAAIVWDLVSRGKASAAEGAEERWSLWRLLLASFLVIFAELALIRWIGVEVRVFAYFKNLALLVCFVGFGMGCALAAWPVRWRLGVWGLCGLIFLVRLPLAQRERLFEGLSAILGSGSDHSIWVADPVTSGSQFLLAAAIAAALLFLITTMFIPLGQVVSRQIALAPRLLPAYSWNLLASLAGIVVFLGLSRNMQGPALWMAVVLAGAAALQSNRMRTLQVFCLMLAAAAVLREPQLPDHFVWWTPYQQIEVFRHRFPDGEALLDLVRVNHTGYQTTVNLSPDFLRRHPDVLGASPGYTHFDLPFRFARPGNVLIVGAGTGNDAAAALRSGSTSVDAVEIDPAIYALGRNTHPEHPYDSPQVHAYLTDARAFLRRTPQKYDLILFAGLDSHTEFSDYSNMRLDNFVYTQEAFDEAKAHLAPDGVVFVKFEVNRRWLGARLAGLLARSFGKPPLVFAANSRYVGQSICFAISASNQVQQVLRSDPQLAEMAQRQPDFVGSPAPPLTTDDWPYLYTERRAIPLSYYTLGALVVLLGVALYWQIPGARQQRPPLFFFAMGAGFMLLETQTISRLALFFGTTWQVNGIVIAAVLLTLLLANLVAEQWPRTTAGWWSAAGLLLSLLAAYLIPMEKLSDSATAAGTMASAIFAVPVFFAGLLFAGKFRDCRQPAAALGSNMLGAVAGGLLENLSFMFGMRALLLVAVAVYAVAAGAGRKIED